MSQFAHPRGCVLWFNLATLEGTKVYDQSGYKNHGTIYGARWLRGPIGGALSFDGVDDYVEVPDDPSLDITTEITLELYLRPHTVTLAMQTLLSKRLVNECNYQVELIYDKVRLAFHDGTTWRYDDSIGSVTSNEWWHIVITFKRPTVQWWLNGKLDKEDDTWDYPLVANVHPLAMGVRGGTYDYPFDGDIALVRIYNRALSVDEIKAHYYYCLTQLKEG